MVADQLTVAHVLASVDDLAAGPSVSVPALAAALVRHGARSHLHTVAGWRGALERSFVDGLDVRRHALDGGPLGRLAAASASLRAALADAAHEADVIHAHGLWLAPNIYPASAVQRFGARAKFVLSPRGMLGPEARAFSTWRKRAAWALVQRRAAAAAHCLHATADSELAEIRAAGLHQPVAVIPNGIDLPAASLRDARASPERTVLSLGRVHPKKGLDRLLRAWAIVEAKDPAWRLRIVGPAENDCDKALRALAVDLGLTRAVIEGPAFGAEKARAYAEAHLFVLPSLNENFAMTVAEALASGLPVIATCGAPWAGLETERCGWWVDHGPEPLAAALAAAMGLDDETRAAMGARGRAWMTRDFSWDRIGADMLAVYHWLARGDPPPPTVRFD